MMDLRIRDAWNVLNLTFRIDESEHRLHIAAGICLIRSPDALSVIRQGAEYRIRRSAPDPR
jgi:hypothetical protein